MTQLERVVWMGNGSSDSNNEQKWKSLLNSLFEQADAADVQSIYVVVVEGTASCSLKIPMNIPYMTYISVA